MSCDNGKIEIKIVENESPLTFEQAHEALDRWVDGLNEELRNRGFHRCQAFVGATLCGDAVLAVVYPLNLAGPGGSPQTYIAQVRFLPPWNRNVEVDDVGFLNAALAECERQAALMCSKHPAKPLRLSFSALARAMGRVAIAQPAPQIVVR